MLTIMTTVVKNTTIVVTTITATCEKRLSFVEGNGKGFSSRLQKRCHKLKTCALAPRPWRKNEINHRCRAKRRKRQLKWKVMMTMTTKCQGWALVWTLEALGNITGCLQTVLDEAYIKNKNWAWKILSRGGNRYRSRIFLAEVLATRMGIGLWCPGTGKQKSADSAKQSDEDYERQHKKLNAMKY